ncbi:MAG: two-component sensor histidine kinase [Desulfobacterium sp.]|nr:two-component sensor histidine kinase [Desulfobacterium sp.]
MELEQEAGVPINQPHAKKRGEEHYSKLYRKFIFLTLICSLVPLFLVGWGIYAYYSGFSKIRIMNYFENQVEHHREIIELFLRERTSDLQLVILTHSPDYLQNPGNLRRIFSIMNQGSSFFTDLGLIDDKGNHLAYIGPYDLMDKNYSQAFWFKEVMNKGIYISDMFTGFRKAPHFIIAVTRIEGNRKWILRASVDTEYFRSLVENVKIGASGEVYLSNQEGILQTTPRFSGKIMGKAPLPIEFFSKESGIGIYEADNNNPSHRFPRQLVGYTWLKNPRWKLVVKQDYAEAFRDANQANRAALISLHLSLLIILVISVISTRYMINIIKKQDSVSDLLNKQLVQAGKMASLGELSAGVAHEINNPLAIILTECQVMKDTIDDAPSLNNEVRTELTASLSQTESQVHRCSLITQSLLKFSRRSKSQREMVNLNAFLEEVIGHMEGKAKGIGIQFALDLEKDIPSFPSDPSLLQQVLLNLINNAIDAHEGKPYGTISIGTRTDSSRHGVEITVSDTGSGISPENIEKIFDPFFTTKAVGKGTGLGLSITYSTIKGLGGDISVSSIIGKGTQFKIFLPFRPSDNDQENQENVIIQPQSSILKSGANNEKT